MVSPSYSASSSSSSSSNATYHFPCPQERNTFKPPVPSPARHFHSSLHSVRKPYSTKIMKKLPIAPMPPTPRRVYKVDSSNFKQLVQKLTAAPEFQSRRLESMAPHPLSLPTTTVSDKPSTTLELLPSPIAITPMSETYSELMSEKLEKQAWNQSDSLATASPAGFSLSPMSHASCSSEILDTESWKESDSLATASPVGFSLSPMSHAWCSSEILDTEPWKESESLAMASPMGSSLSPWSHMWSSFPLLSPGTVSSLERGM